MATGGRDQDDDNSERSSPPAIIDNPGASFQLSNGASAHRRPVDFDDPDDEDSADSASRDREAARQRRYRFVEPSDSEFSDSERLRPSLKSRSPSPPVRRRKPCLVQRSFDSDAEFWVASSNGIGGATSSVADSSSRPPSALKNSSGGWRRRDSDGASVERRQSRRQSEENGGIELIGSIRPSDLTASSSNGGCAPRRIVNITLSDGSRFAADPNYFRRYPNSLLGRLANSESSSSSTEAAANQQEWCHLPDGVTLDAFRALLGLYSDQAKVRWRPYTATTSTATATESRRSSDATTATSIAAAAAVASVAAAAAAASSSAVTSVCTSAPSPAELRLACRLLDLPFAPDAMRGCPDLRGLLHEISNDGARERFSSFLEEAILPQLASCALRGERECQLVVLADDDVVDWDPDNPPQMVDWDLEPLIVRSTAMCRFLKYVENRDVAKQVLRHRRLKKIRIGIEGYPTRMESVKRRAGGRADAIYSYAQRPFLRVSWEKEENRHVDFQCVVQVKNDATSDNGGGLQAAAVERPVDLPPSLTPPLPVGNNGNDNSPNQDVGLNGVDGGSVDDV
ncbi:hypothetical protein BOX15_Mlig008781g1 [Macrostomum lignano]|uniref:BTBD10/KCTD20 BTB/POZ domain-containing protein n=1 Tax=Macrostomum lignano TaxID=282301 RepID=A0A267FS76_9PLAT|nr:hypothetical protein BOX15_Mlig008781g1 [Macrostomum lignano]